MKIETVILFITAAIVLWAWVVGWKTFNHAFIVPEGYAGLLYRKGVFVELLGPGRHIRWGRFWTLDAADTRKAYLPIAAQEILTADNVSVKLTLMVAYQVTDPVKAAHATQRWHDDVYNAAQAALRAVIGGIASDALLAQRVNIAAQLLERVQPQTAPVGVTVQAVEVKDVMLPADLKRAFAEVLKAKQEGQAALERARGESAALRNLANAARVLEGNPALMNLRVLQSLSAAQNAGSTLVLGVPGGLVPLKNGNSRRTDSTDTEAP
jgi:regulator of protease activity HflC (stomatin/prohibitin superfamily)